MVFSGKGYPILTIEISILFTNSHFFWLGKIRNIKNTDVVDGDNIIAITYDNKILVEEVINKLPFTLTCDQLNSIKEIYEDLISKKRMNRLLQGDVGSGKTIVSIIAAYKAVKSGYQAVIMAPTAILASQQLETFGDNLLMEVGMLVGILTCTGLVI